MDDPRLWLLELLAYWEGRVNATNLQTEFNIGRTQAQKNINSYQKTYSNNLSYNASVKGFVPTSDFKPGFISGNVDEYLDWRHGISHVLPREPNTLVIGPIARHVSPVVMRALIKAMREQMVVEVDYVSLTNPDHQGRLIAPHCFVKTSQRWHLRAYCEKNHAFRDFVLSRFRGTPEVEKKSEHGAEDDLGWNTQIELIIQPDPRLTAAQRQVLEQDYGMTNGQLIITTRAALATYMLKDQQIQTKMLEGDPVAQQLILVNRSAIEPWLF